MALMKILRIPLRIFYYFLISIFSCFWGVFMKKKQPNFSCDIVLITGAAQGLGKELALQFSECGATVVLWDINETKLRQTCSEITAQGREAFGFVVDCSKKEQIYEMAEKVKDEIGNVSVLVNNAGVLYGKTITELEDEDIEKTMNVNFLSHYWTIRAFLPWMLENDYGYIVEIGSVSAYTGGPLVSDYGASKAAIVNFAHSIHSELLLTRKSGISVTCMCPWHMTTSLVIPRVAKFVKVIPSLTPQFVAEKTIQSVNDKKFLVILPKIWNILALLNFILPRRVMDEIFLTFFA